jgi:hypothetical protein
MVEGRGVPGHIKRMGGATGQTVFGTLVRTKSITAGKQQEIESFDGRNKRK